MAYVESFVKGKLVFVEEREAREGYGASRVLSIDQARPGDGKPVRIEVVSEKPTNGRKIGDIVEMFVRHSGTKNGGIFTKEQ